MDIGVKAAEHLQNCRNQCQIFILFYYCTLQSDVTRFNVWNPASYCMTNTSTKQSLIDLNSFLALLKVADRPLHRLLPHPLPSSTLRKPIISCLLNTWRQTQRGNYWGHSHVCTQPSLTHRTSFRAENGPVVVRREKEQQWGPRINPWHVKCDTTNVSEPWANKGRNSLLVFHQAADLELCQAKRMKEAYPPNI